jgi:hypothetical protein
MIRMLMTTLLQDKKISELHKLTEKYKQQYKKEVHGTVRSQENDLAYTQQVNFCRMAGSILKAPNSSTGGLRSILNKDIVEEFMKETSDSSFVVPNNEMVLNNMSHLLVELMQRAIENQTDCYSNIISIYSEHHLAIKRATKSTWAHRSQKHHKNVIRRNGNRPLNTDYELVSPALGFLSKVVASSYSITTNRDEECYMLNRKDLVAHAAQFIRENTLYTQNLINRFKDHYLMPYIDAQYLQTITASQTSFIRKKFTKIIKSFHKLIESHLTEKNFEIIFSLDQLSKYIKYNYYDNSIYFEKLFESLSHKYQKQISDIGLESKNTTLKLENYQRNLSIGIKDYVYVQHHQNMAEMKYN